MAGQSDLARELLSLARDDESAARALLEVDSVSDAIIGFHAQQAVEKSLKAALSVLGVEFPFTHDLEGLSELCAEADLSLPAQLEEVDRLSPYGARLRYGAVDPGTVDRQTALLWASTAVAWCAEQLERHS